MSVIWNKISMLHFISLIAFAGAPYARYAVPLTGWLYAEWMWKSSSSNIDTILHTYIFWRILAQQLKLEETPRIRLRAKRCKNGKRGWREWLTAAAVVCAYTRSRICYYRQESVDFCACACELAEWERRWWRGVFLLGRVEATVFTQFISFIFAHFATISRIHGVRRVGAGGMSRNAETTTTTMAG